MLKEKMKRKIISLFFEFYGHRVKTHFGNEIKLKSDRFIGLRRDLIKEMVVITE